MKSIITIFATMITALVFISAISSCSSVHEQSAKPSPAATRRPASAPAAPAEIQMEGGIVGTGNEEECKNSENKDSCNDNVK